MAAGGFAQICSMNKIAFASALSLLTLAAHANPLDYPASSVSDSSQFSFEKSPHNMKRTSAFALATKYVSVSDTFTVTLTGCGASTVGTARYTLYRDGIVHVKIPLLSCTSNAATKTMTGFATVPALLPARLSRHPLGIVVDSAIGTAGVGSLGITGVDTVYHAKYLLGTMSTQGHNLLASSVGPFDFEYSVK